MVPLIWALLPACVSTAEPGALVPPTADQDPLLPQVQIEVAGHRRAVHAVAIGEPDAPLLLVLHGSLGDHRALRALDPLAERYHVVYWDQRGNGLSERIDAAEMSDAAVVDEIDAMRALFGPDQPVTLVGHSFGAMYAALYASRRPEQVAQLALAEPGGLNSDVFLSTAQDLIDVEVLSAGMTERMWQSRTLSADDHAELDYRAVQVLHDGHLMSYWCDPEALPPWPLWRPGAHLETLRSQRLWAEGFDYARGLDQFPREVLLLGTDCSGLGADFQRAHHLPLFADARLVEIEGAGHRLITEQTDAVLEALMGYLDAFSEAGAAEPGAAGG